MKKNFNKVSFLTWATLELFLMIIPYSLEAQTADAGPDLANYKRQGVKIGAPKLSDENWCYMWKATPADPSLKAPSIAQPIVNPSQKTTYTLTLSYKGVNEFHSYSTDEVEVYIINQVKFEPHATQKYGFDDGIYEGPDNGKKWKSVEFDKFDHFQMKVDPVESVKFVKLKSLNQRIALISPEVATTSPQRLDIYGARTSGDDNSSRETKVEAYCYNGIKDIILDEIGIVVYSYVKKTVAIRLVHEENDDVQVIPKWHGKPNSIAIEGGQDGILNTTTSDLNNRIAPDFGYLGDDFIINIPGIGLVVDTGKNGVCETMALPTDHQRIEPHQGEPNELCVFRGENNMRDTPLNPLGDDKVVFENIYTGSDGICNATAKDINEVTTDYKIEIVNDYLNNNAFKQAMVDWEVHVLPTMAINADIDYDGWLHLDGSLITMSNEASIIIDKGKDTNYDFNVFLVGLGYLKKVPEILYGVSNSGIYNRYIFVCINQILKKQLPPTVENTIAHELGHADFGLDHPNKITCYDESEPQPTAILSNYLDNKNIMDYCNGSLFRKFQWDEMHKQQ